MFSFFKGGSSPKQDAAERLRQINQMELRQRREADERIQQHSEENKAAIKKKATQQAIREEIEKKWRAEEEQARLDAQEKAWIQEHPDMAKEWQQGNRLGIDLSVDPDALTNKVGWGGNPTLPEGLPWSSQSRNYQAKPDVADQRRAESARIDHEFEELTRLMRQFAIQFDGVHPEEGRKPKPISVSQLGGAVKKLGTFMEDCSSEWVWNEQTQVYERPRIIHLMGQEVKGSSDDHHEISTFSNFGARRDAQASSLPMLEDADAHLSFSVHRGLLEEGGDIGSDLLTIEEAKVRCRELPGCKGFSFKGNDPDSAVPIMCYFKSHFKLSQGWRVGVWTSVRADWTGDMPVIEELLSIALPAYMTKAAGKATEGSVEL